MMIGAYDGKRAYNSRYIRSIQLRRGEVARRWRSSRTSTVCGA